MRILLTGGGGFIGRNILASPLARAHTIVAPRSRQLDLTHDEQVDEFFRGERFDVVIHGAIKPGHRNAPERKNLYYADSRMFFNLLRHADRFGRLIVLSSGSVYDMARQDLRKVDEDFFGRSIPVDESAFFRYVSTGILEHRGDLDVVDLRIFSIFGKYEDYAIRFISNAICKALCGLPITIRQNRRFIDDLMPVLEHFIAGGHRHRSYNVTPDESLELRVLAEKILRISGRDLPILVREPGLGLEYSGSNRRLREEIPGLRLTPIDDALRSLYCWYSENLPAIDRNALLVDK